MLEAEFCFHQHDHTPGAKIHDMPHFSRTYKNFETVFKIRNTLEDGLEILMGERKNIVKHH